MEKYSRKNYSHVPGSQSGKARPRASFACALNLPARELSGLLVFRLGIEGHQHLAQEFGQFLLGMIGERRQDLFFPSK